MIVEDGGSWWHLLPQRRHLYFAVSSLQKQQYRKYSTQHKSRSTNFHFASANTWLLEAVTFLHFLPPSCSPQVGTWRGSSVMPLAMPLCRNQSCQGVCSLTEWECSHEWNYSVAKVPISKRSIIVWSKKIDTLVALDPVIFSYIIF